MFDKVGLGYLAAYLPGHLPAGQFEIFTELLQVKVPGTFPITPATSGPWPALRPPGVFEFTTANNWPRAASGQGPATGFKHPT